MFDTHSFHEDGSVIGLIQKFENRELSRKENNAISELGSIANDDYGRSIASMAEEFSPIKDDAEVGIELGLVENDPEEGYRFTNFGKNFFRELLNLPIDHVFP